MMNDSPASSSVSSHQNPDIWELYKQLRQNDQYSTNIRGNSSSEPIISSNVMPYLMETYRRQPRRNQVNMDKNRKYCSEIPYILPKRNGSFASVELDLMQMYKQQGEKRKNQEILESNKRNCLEISHKYFVDNTLGAEASSLNSSWNYYVSPMSKTAFEDSPEADTSVNVKKESYREKPCASSEPFSNPPLDISFDTFRGPSLKKYDFELTSSAPWKKPLQKTHLSSFAIKKIPDSKRKDFSCKLDHINLFRHPQNKKTANAEELDGYIVLKKYVREAYKYLMSQVKEKDDEKSVQPSTFEAYTKESTPDDSYKDLTSLNEAIDVWLKSRTLPWTLHFVGESGCVAQVNVCPDMSRSEQRRKYADVANSKFYIDVMSKPVHVGLDQWIRCIELHKTKHQGNKAKKGKTEDVTIRIPPVTYALGPGNTVLGYKRDKDSNVKPVIGGIVSRESNIKVAGNTVLTSAILPYQSQRWKSNNIHSNGYQNLGAQLKDNVSDASSSLFNHCNHLDVEEDDIGIDLNDHGTDAEEDSGVFFSNHMDDDDI